MDELELQLGQGTGQKRFFLGSGFYIGLGGLNQTDWDLC